MAAGAWAGSWGRSDLAALGIHALKAGQGQLGHHTRSLLELAQKAFQHYQLLPQAGEPVRAVTIRAIKLEPHGQPEQLDLYSDFRRREKQEAIDDTVDELRRRFGKGAIRAASLLGDLKIPDDGREEVVMPRNLGIEL